ncbi:MAG: hypothetical protein JNL60_12565 [Bacteroidia bacterium]|nr:hypothetical protein [Bacteroidia bacterium]
MKKIICFVLLCLHFVSFSQEKRKKTAPYSIRGNIGIPRTISSQMFRTCFNGVYEAGLSVNFRLFDNFCVGVGYQNTFFQNNKNVFVYYTVPASQKTGGSTLSYDTKLMGHGGCIKLSYDQFFEKGYFSYSIHAGAMRMNYLNVISDTTAPNQPFVAQYFTSPYIQPEIAIHFLADRAASFSIMLSYTNLLYKYDPKAPRFANFEQVSNKKNNYIMSWLNIGFGFNIMIGKD